MHKTLTVPLDILLVLRRHIFLDRAVLVESTVQSAMGANTISAVEHLNRGAGHAHIYFLPDVLKWHRVAQFRRFGCAISVAYAPIFGR